MTTPVTAPSADTASIAKSAVQQKISTVRLDESDTTLGFPTLGHLRKFVAAATDLPDETAVNISTAGTTGTIAAEATELIA